MKNEFISNFAINEEVEFQPMYRQQQQMGISHEPMDGKIIAIRFTEAKVFYDVFNNYWGKVFENVASEKVFGLTEKQMLESVKEDINQFPDYTEKGDGKTHTDIPDVSRVGLIELNDLKRLRNYFGENDKTQFEHSAFRILSNAILTHPETDHKKEDTDV